MILAKAEKRCEIISASYFDELISRNGMDALLADIRSGMYFTLFVFCTKFLL